MRVDPPAGTGAPLKPRRTCSSCGRGRGPILPLEPMGLLGFRPAVALISNAFLLGRGSGIRLSEPVYRILSSDERAPWDKEKLPVVYPLNSPP